MTGFPYVVEYADYARQHTGSFRIEQCYPIHEWLEANYPELECAYHGAGGWYEKYKNCPGKNAICPDKDFRIDILYNPKYMGDTRDTCLVSFKDEQVAMHFKLKFG
jgi:hypothetical protein